ncbi:D-alanyl-D-alanine carboxypeptidase family protein [Alkaliphilus hydrothermalis]|uniref:serine-type D-Ala-D-Ala carboxypeptidase n=1 Tax=Alkaliphilus hydrothermalis TaxID=1482730 RepID=A0ABS2NLT4_9FIRM|nr:D-alanyl-D-alanine carboxypeptidase family protein [Alkaliphilus hydrothermalis]MBM7613851.1 D-alanyl-D-alanine carboxypeptidase (penicillin-binding protein 5/6) [Alkaliphilus hydrothermalis]
MKKIPSKLTSLISMILLITILSTSSVFAAPQMTAPNAVLMDFQSGEVLYDHNAHEITFPASTTKVMTAILVIENTKLDDVVTVDKEYFVDGASMYLKEGESFTVEELLQALMIRSANDVTELFATHISGSVEEFAKLMNERAKQLGAKNTHFTNPHGLPNDNHVTTAYDLAIIGRHAMTFPKLREIARTTNVVFEETPQTPEKRYYRNSNRLLWGTGGGNQILYRGQYVNIKYDVVEGIKTGYTVAAQQCLITSAMQNEHRIIAVVLGAKGSNIYLDTRTLIDYGFENFKSQPLLEEGVVEAEIPLNNGIKESLSLVTASGYAPIFPIDKDTSTIKKEIVLNKDVDAPVYKGTAYGKIVYTIGNETLKEIDLVATETIEAKPPLIQRNKPFRYLVYFLVAFTLWKLLVFYLRLKKQKRVGFMGSRRRSNGLQFSKRLRRR